MLAMLISFFACDEDMYYEPSNYPHKMIFKGVVYNTEFTPVEGIRITFSTPDNLNHDTVYSDSTGVWYLKRTLEFAGPNKVRVRDIDQGAHGGTFLPLDSTFYITKNQYDSNLVIMDFKLLQ